MTKTFNIKIKEEDLNLIREASKKLGISVASLLKSSALKEIKNLKKQELI